MTDPNTIQFVEALLAIPLVLVGISHIVQKQMWVEFFAGLAAQGHSGVVWRTFVLELWPAVLIVVFHQDWSVPGVIITLYGHLLMAKVVVSLLYPPLGLRSMHQADRAGSKAFIIAGLALIGIGALCGYRVLVGFN